MILPAFDMISVEFLERRNLIVAPPLYIIERAKEDWGSARRGSASLRLSKVREDVGMPAGGLSQF